MITALAAVLIFAIGVGCVALATRVNRAAESARPASSPAAAATVAPEPELVAENPVEQLVLLLRRKPIMRIGLSVLSLCLLAGAGVMIGYPFYTNQYQERYQASLDRQIASPEIRTAYLQRTIEEGDSLTRIRIPAINVDTVVVEGTSASALRAGAGHYPNTPLPCELGNVAIAGHRTTYGRPFHNLDLLSPGDEIILETPIGSCTYEIDVEWFIVLPTDVDIVDNTPDEARLTLTTCHPKGSARERLVVTAKLISSQSTDA